LNRRQSLLQISKSIEHFEGNTGKSRQDPESPCMKECTEVGYCDLIEIWACFLDQDLKYGLNLIPE